MPLTPIETTNLLLRELMLDDSLVLAPILTNTDVMKFSLGPKSIENPLIFIQEQIFSYQTNKFGLWGIFHKTDKRLIGVCGISLYLLGQKPIHELSYRIDPFYWGQGIGTEALLAVKEFSFSTLGLNQLCSLINPFNTPLIRIAKKLEMGKAGDDPHKGLDIYETSFFSIQTERLLIRELTLKDEPHLKMLADKNDDSNKEDLFINISVNRNLFIRLQMQNYKKYGYGIWGITLNNHLIGLGGINVEELEKDTPIQEFYIFIERRYRTKRLGYEASQAILQYATKTLGLNEIISLINASDVQSRRIAESLNMRLTKELQAPSGSTLVYTLSL